MSDTKSNKEGAWQPIENKVAQSGLITLDLEELYPTENIIELDISQFLFQGLLLKEKEFKAALAAHNWQQYAHSIVAVYCSTNALIQPWAFMLITKRLHIANALVKFGTVQQVLVDIYNHKIANLDVTSYQGKKLMVKGCSSKAVPQAVFGIITARLLPVVQSLMYGEACSNVPVFKKKKQ